MIRGRRAAIGRGLCWVFAGLLLSAPSGLRALVLNEIMYHPPEAVDQPLEWFELFNERLDPIDLSGYTVCNGVQYEFPAGTWLDGYEYIVVASDVAAFSAKYDTSDITVVGGWTGALDNNGESLEICNPAGITILDARYNDRGKWPVAADGTGHSLALINPYTHEDDPDNWLHSVATGGTPGEWNGFTSQVSGGPPPQNGMDGSGFILNWLMLGPYTGADCQQSLSFHRADWLRESAGGKTQTDLVWEEDETVNTNYSLAQSSGLHANAPFNTPRVELYESFGDTIDMNAAVWPPDPNDVMSYSFVYVDNVTGSSLPITIACASDDAIDVRVNGASVHTNSACRAVGGSGTVQDRASATLNAGKNLIAVKVFERGGGWSFRLRIEERGNGNPITSAARIQVTTDVNQGLDFDGNGTPIIDPGSVGGGGPGDPGTFPGEAPVVVNEALLRTGGDRWVELYNRTGSSIDLSDYYLTDDPAVLDKVQIAAGTSIPAGGFLSFTEAGLGFDLAVSLARPRVFFALVKPDGMNVMDAFNFEPEFDGMSEARLPDGDRDFDDAADPTRDAPNEITVNQDIVINEIMYHPIVGGSDREWIELYHRGTQSVDIGGWALTNGFNFVIPPGTTMDPGSYLVIARNPALIRDVYGLTTAEVIGAEDDVARADFGVLRDAGERVTLQDLLGRTVDTANYRDGGEWPRWADGHGSSIELIDATQDNRFGQAWDASDDSDKAEVGEFSYISRHGGGEPELHVLLLSRGITVVDDLSVREGGIITNDETLVERGETWRYFKGLTAPPANWNTLGFNDSGWLEGETGIGYGDGDDATELLDMEDNYISVFLRREFTIADVNDLDDIVLNVLVDDGFAAYINGVEVATFNMARGTEYDSPASASVADFSEVERDISSFRHLLRNGSNVLAVQVHNLSLGSSDLSCNPSLVSRVTSSNGPERVVNPTFNSGTTGWMIEGNHVRSGRTTDDPIRGSGSLKIVATGKGDNKVNRIETSNSGINTLSTSQDLYISFKARWVVGSRTILTHGFRHTMPRSHELRIPDQLGTPGRINSVTLRQQAANGGNLGPVLTDLLQDPPVPEEDEDVTIRVRASDSDGVDTVTLRYSSNSIATSPSSIPMDSIGGGWYEAVVPGASSRTRRVIFLEATDGAGAEGRYPVDVLSRTHPIVLDPDESNRTDQRYIVYRHDTPDPSTPYHSYRFWMTSNHENILNNRRRHSNDVLPGSFLFGSEKIYHEAGARFAGSPFARGGWGGSWRVQMPRDEWLHERYRKFNMENHGADARERISHYLIRQTNVGAVPVPYADVQVLVRWQVNDRTTATREHTWAPDPRFLTLWYPNDDDGDLFEVDDRFIIDDNGNRAGSTDARVRYPPQVSPRSSPDPADKENYRWFFGRRNERGSDDFSELVEFCRLMDPGVTGTADYDRRVFDEVNVEEMIRIWAVRMNTDDWDTWGTNRGKNCYLYRTAIGQQWHLFAWDLELTYGSTGSFLIPSSPSSAFNPSGKFQETNRMINRPAIKRRYYAVLDEMVNGPDAWFGSGFLNDYMVRLGNIGMGRTDIGRPNGFIDQRANTLRTRISSVVYPSVRMRISTNGGSNFETDQLTVNLAGTAPVEVAEILVVNNGDEGRVYPVGYNSMTGWSIDDIEINSGDNELLLLGFDYAGDLIDDDSITVTSTFVSGPAPVLTALDPTTAFPGETVEITGSGFNDTVQVFFGERRASDVVFVNETTVTAEVPIGDAAVEVGARNVGSPLSNTLPFDYPPAPVLTSVEPATGVPGEVVDIAGSGFHDSVRVFFGPNEAATISFIDANNITAEVPPGSGDAPVAARNITGGDSNALAFSYPPQFLRGDPNGDLRVDVSDAVKVLLYAFAGSALDCEESADADDNGAIELTDAVYIVDFLYRDGPAPSEPFPFAGFDFDADDLGCEN